MSNKDQLEDKIYFNKYKPDKKIGEGSFGKIYSASNINTGEKYALKFENKSGGQNLLESEAYVLCYLKGHGIPAVKSYGFSGDHNILVMELLGKSLEDLFQESNCKFSMKTVCMIANEMLTRIEYIHTRHIIHRDIKPDNFIMGVGVNEAIVYAIDFGLAKKYRSSRNLQHIKYTNNKKLTGTARYASINALRGSEQSRRDDLEAIGYVLMYFLKGALPWQGLKVDKREDRYKKIYEKKKNTTAEELCVGFPGQFIEYINYTRNLSFEQEPDYEYLRGLFTQVMNKMNFNFDSAFEWLKNPPDQDIKARSGLNILKANESGIVEDRTKQAMEKEKIIDNKNFLGASNILHLSNAQNELNSPFHIPTNPINPQNKFVTNGNAVGGDRNNTMKANLNTLVHVTQNETNQKKVNTIFNQSLALNNKESKIETVKERNIENMDESRLRKDKNKSKCCIL